MAGFLARESIVAGPRFNRWLVPPAALAIHLCIGMAYGFSVFWLPMSKLMPGAPACTRLPRRADRYRLQLDRRRRHPHLRDLHRHARHFRRDLGRLARARGAAQGRASSRRCAGAAASRIGGYGVMIHQLWLVFLGCGFIGGIGQGLGYITPVSTLIKWFPDRRGMATGFAIMGYGGGAMIGSPLAVWLMAQFAQGGVRASA